MAERRRRFQRTGLKQETVQAAEKNNLGRIKIKGLHGGIPALSNYAEFFPGMPKSWALTFMINDEDAPTGRPAGSLAWAGLPNLYYWIDRKNGIGGDAGVPVRRSDLGRRLPRLRRRSTTTRSLRQAA